MIDEAVSVGKGANTVISLLHHYLDHYSYGEQHLHLHADNCSGQNKNNTMLQYLMWRIHTGRNSSVSLHFMIAGHTKFAVDWGFGLLKRKFRKTKVDCLADLAKVINDSSHVNIPVQVGDETGRSFVTMYDWSTFLSSSFIKCPNLLQQHHFHFDKDHSGVVLTQKFVNSEKFKVKIQKGRIRSGMPSIIEPVPMTNQRQQYLFHHIRQFVDPDLQDLVCPQPTVVEPELSKDATPSSPSPRGRGRGRGHGRGRGRARGQGRAKARD
jgi:hypothetical protein